jgi:hypothetical protein
VTTPAEARLQALARFVTRYSATVSLIASATNIPQSVDLIVRQKIHDSGNALTYSEALRAVFAADPELKRAYAES